MCNRLIQSQGLFLSYVAKTQRRTYHSTSICTRVQRTDSKSRPFSFSVLPRLKEEPTTRHFKYNSRPFSFPVWPWRMKVQRIPLDRQGFLQILPNWPNPSPWQGPSSYMCFSLEKERNKLHSNGTYRTEQPQSSQQPSLSLKSSRKELCPEY